MYCPIRAGFVFALALQLGAHDLYLMPERFLVNSGATIEVEFHNGDSFPESEVAPRVARLEQASLLSSSRIAPVVNLHLSGKVVRGSVKVPGPGNLILTVRTTPNFIELEPAKFSAYLKEEGLNGVMEWRSAHHEESRAGRERYTKFAKSILLAGAPDDYYRHPAGLLIEIVPEVNPYTAASNGKFPVRVLFRGESASDLQMEMSSVTARGSETTIVGRTDKDGRISAPLKGHGRYRLHTLRMERCSQPSAADWESYWASLTFEVP
jgi:hypothetical protein